jgi:hypothetical protein
MLGLISAAEGTLPSDQNEWITRKTPLGVTATVRNST